MKDSGFRIRVDDELRGQFVSACRARDLTAAQVLRNFMRDFVQQIRPDQLELFQGVREEQTGRSQNNSKGHHGTESNGGDVT